MLLLPSMKAVDVLSMMRTNANEVVVACDMIKVSIPVLGFESKYLLLLLAMGFHFQLNLFYSKADLPPPPLSSCIVPVKGKEKNFLPR